MTAFSVMVTFSVALMPLCFYQWAALRAPLIYMSHFVTLLEDQVEEGVNLKQLNARDNAQHTN